MFDDCSQDNSLEILRKFIDKEKNITLIENKINKGTASHANYGIDNASGDIIYFAAADDVVLPICLKSLLKHLKSTQILGY